jgi:hypothetical protein
VLQLCYLELIDLDGEEVNELDVELAHKYAETEGVRIIPHL